MLYYSLGAFRSVARVFSPSSRLVVAVCHLVSENHVWGIPFLGNAQIDGVH